MPAHDAHRSAGHGEDHPRAPVSLCGRRRPHPCRAVAARGVPRGELRHRQPGGVLAHRSPTPDARHRGSSLGGPGGLPRRGPGRHGTTGRLCPRGPAGFQRGEREAPDSIRREPRRRLRTVARRARGPCAARVPDRASGDPVARVRQRGLRSHPQLQRTVLRVLPTLHPQGSRRGRRPPDAGSRRPLRREARNRGNPGRGARPAGDHPPSHRREPAVAGPLLPAC